MSAFDLFPQETAERLGNMRPVTALEPGVFDGFFRGTGMLAMQGLAKAARAVDLIGSFGPILEDKTEAFKTGRTAQGVTTAQDAYFREHDEVFGRAVDYWTPKPGEVGVAGEITGQLLSTLPMIVASPGLAVATAQLSAGEDLVIKGVDAGKAGAVGAAQGIGLATGIWMPIFGKNLWQRIVLGGAGFNVVQGAATRAASGMILDGTAAGEEFKALDARALTLDLLLGVAFGGLSHLSSAQRAEGAKMWDRIDGWTKTLKPSDVDALVALRQAEHLSVEAAPGKLATLTDIEAHTQRMRQAVDDLVNGRSVSVEDMAPVRFENDAARTTFQADTLDYLQQQARALILEGVDAKTRAEQAAALPGFMRTAEDRLAMRDPGAAPSPEIARAIDIAAKPGFQRTADEKVFLDAMPNGKAGEYLKVPEPRADVGPPLPENLLPEAAGLDPLQAEAVRFADANPDVSITVGTNPDGSPMTTTLRSMLAEADGLVKTAADDAKLFDVAAACMLGVR